VTRVERDWGLESRSGLLNIFAFSFIEQLSVFFELFCKQRSELLHLELYLALDARRLLDLVLGLLFRVYFDGGDWLDSLGRLLV